MVLDEGLTDGFIHIVIDRYTPEELVTLLNLSVEDLIDAFYERTLENYSVIMEDLGLV